MVCLFAKTTIVLLNINVTIKYIDYLTDGDICLIHLKAILLVAYIYQGFTPDQVKPIKPIQTNTQWRFLKIQ